MESSTKHLFVLLSIFLLLSPNISSCVSALSFPNARAAFSFIAKRSSKVKEYANGANDRIEVVINRVQENAGGPAFCRNGKPKNRKCHYRFNNDRVSSFYYICVKGQKPCIVSA